MASKRIIVLDRLRNKENQIGDQSPQCWNVAFWADVPAARQSFYADATLTSAVRNINASDLTAIQNGSVTEMVMVVQVDKGSTLSQMQIILQDLWTAYQAKITAYNPWIRYGTFWDGTSWTAGGVS